MQLIIAEKPSVAQSISKVIGATKHQDDYVEVNGYIVLWCVGHLVELAAADQYDPRYSKWVRTDLPIVPEPWQFNVSAATKKQFAILKSLMGRSDVESLVCATDAGREALYHPLRRQDPQRGACYDPNAGTFDRKRDSE